MLGIRPLARHKESASCLYSCVNLARSRAGLLICVFMWTLRVFDPKRTIRQIRATPGEYSTSALGWDEILSSSLVSSILLTRSNSQDSPGRELIDSPMPEEVSDDAHDEIEGAQKQRPGRADNYRKWNEQQQDHGNVEISNRAEPHRTADNGQNQGKDAAIPG